MRDASFIARWQATAIYRTANGPVDIVHDLEEIADLHDLIEGGPHWDTIVRIEIKRVNHMDGESLTVEGAAAL